ncbi:TPA: thiamine phosphate synthase [Candidatus Poribacteria bacterium]|nr:thiamine phosphate synthase [Candidatus Poribacteria bacterium]
MLDNIGLYFITDRNLTKKTIMSDVISAINAGVKIVQYREKDLSTKEMYQEAKAIREITKDKNVILIINDRIDIALAVDADGVHIGQDDMPFEIARKILGEDKIIGLTVHNTDEAILGEKLGANYLGVSPIFATSTKKDAGKPAGIELIKNVKGNVKTPLVAIGGINYENVDEILKTGVSNVAVISAIVTKENVEEECRKFIRKIKDYTCNVKE